MNRDQLIHIVRASARITDETRFVVVGSQLILATREDLPDPLVFSMEADIYPRESPEKAIEIDGGIGEGSMFQSTHGVYGHGVGPETAKCPAGWEDRLIPLEFTDGGKTITAECLEPNDLALSKCVAGRERDWEFVQCAAEEGLVELELMQSRVELLPIADRERQRVKRMLEGIAIRIANA
ncbi:MAG: DUF6036 family nucleotidyltransferase [Solirubrobacterales bacterium]